MEPRKRGPACRTREVRGSNKAKFVLIANEVAVDLQMLGTLVEHRVANDVKSNLVVTPKWDREQNRNMEVAEQEEIQRSSLTAAAMLRYSASTEN
ncbi:UNVERIFIED_CONTAM: hypothetical protein Sindi_0663100 [Sesamum indicum]